jgi:hypothetical protein
MFHKVLAAFEVFPPYFFFFHLVLRVVVVKAIVHARETEHIFHFAKKIITGLDNYNLYCHKSILYFPSNATKSTTHVFSFIATIFLVANSVALNLLFSYCYYL